MLANEQTNYWMNREQKAALSGRGFSPPSLSIKVRSPAAATLTSERSSADQRFHEGGFVKGPVVLVRDRSVNIALKEGEHREPDARPAAVLVGTRVGQGVVVEEEAGGDVEGDEDIDGIVLMSRQDEEDAKQV